MIDMLSWLTWPGDRAEKRGSKPSNTAVRLSAGVVCDSGMVPPLQGSATGCSGKDGQESLTEKVLEVDGRRRGGREVLRAVEAEDTLAWLPCSDTAPTLPTSTPAMRTVSPGWSPEALVKSAA
jgi:hypothetical protein